MEENICDNNDEANFVLNISLDMEGGPLDENKFHQDNLTCYDEDTLPYDPDDATGPAPMEIADEIENGAAIANSADPNHENDRFFNVTEAQLEYIAAQTMADSTKEQTKWGIKIFKGMSRPSNQKQKIVS